MECNQVCQIGYSHRKIKKSGLKVARLFLFFKAQTYFASCSALCCFRPFLRSRRFRQIRDCDRRSCVIWGQIECRRRALHKNAIPVQFSSCPPVCACARAYAAIHYAPDLRFQIESSSNSIFQEKLKGCWWKGRLRCPKFRWELFAPVVTLSSYASVQTFLCPFFPREKLLKYYCRFLPTPMTIKSAFFLSPVRSIEEKEKLRLAMFSIRSGCLLCTWHTSLRNPWLNSGGQSTRVYSLCIAAESVRSELFHSAE